MGEPGGLPSMGSHRVGHDWSDSAAAAEDATSKKKKKRIKNKNNRFFSSAYGSFSGIEHTVGHKISLNKCKGTEITSNIFFDNNSMKLEINHRDQKKEKNEHMQTK